MYCYLEFKLSYLKNLKLFSIRVKELSEPIVLWRKGDGFQLFSQAFCWETDLWVTLGDFTVKKTQNWEGNSVFNWKSIELKRNLLYFRKSQLYVSHMCKRIFKFQLQLSSYWLNIKFSRNCPKFHIFTKIVIFQVYLQLFRPTASSLWISWQGHVRNTLFHFCQLWAVNIKTRLSLNTRSTGD